MEPTLGNVMDAKAISPPYPISDNGFWHYKNAKIPECAIIHATVERADFGRFCNYQGVLCGLSLTLKLDTSDSECWGTHCGWSFESMQDIQKFFNDAKAIYLKDLIGTPVLVAVEGNCIRGMKINIQLVVDKNMGNASHADSISFFTSMAKLVSSENPPKQSRG